MKKFAATLVCIYLAAHLSACTSKESREDEASAPAEETAAVDNELEKVDGAEATDTASADGTAAPTDEQLPEQALGEQPAAGTDTASATPSPSEQPAVDAGATPPADTVAGGTTPPTSEPPADTSMTAQQPNPETPATTTATNDIPTPGVDPGGSGATTDTVSSPPPAAPKASLKKVKDAPFHEGGQLLNAVYVARKGDDYKKIASLIYGDAKRAKDLKKANPGLSSPHVGDKIYYNSPSRPTDEAMMKNYYEDSGMQSEVYVAKDGDDLKKVAKQLLGDKNSWKELWVTNKELESKGSLTAGTEIHYWKGAAPAPTMANNGHSKKDKPMDVASATTEMAPPAEQLPPPPPADLPPPPPSNQMAANNPPAEQLPPPPPPPDMGPPPNGAGTTVAEVPPPPPPAEMAPPPPPPVEQAPPPPPPTPQKGPKHEVAQDQGFSNDDMMMGLAAAGILAAGVAAIMVIRKRRQQKEMAAAFGDTQIGAS